MDSEFYSQLKTQAQNAVSELIDTAKLKKGDILVIGCSSSEIIGKQIGKESSVEAAKAVVSAIYPILTTKGLYIAAQCCEHLNRAIVIERECAEKYNYDIVSVVPQPKAGGSFATTVYENLADPVVVESIKAHAGIDIGNTLIGMHLRVVAVPVRINQKTIGQANIVCARTRPKYIGGPRANYSDNQA